MSMTRWDPFSEMMTLRDAMNRLFEESFVRPRGALATGVIIPVDVRESEDTYDVWISLPGCHPEDCNITIQQDTLRVTGEFHSPDFKHGEQPMQQQAGAQQGSQTQQQAGGQRAGQMQQQAREQWLVREIPQGRFSRTITLPSTVNADQASAEFDAGILHVRLPKAAEAMPRRLQVRGERAQQQQIGQGPQRQ